MLNELLTNCKHLIFIYCLCFLFCSWISFSTHYSPYTWWLHSWSPSSLITLCPAVDRNVVYMCGLILRLPGGSLLLPKTMSSHSGLVEFSDGWNGLDSKGPDIQGLYEQALLHIGRHSNSDAMVVEFCNLTPNVSPYSSPFHMVNSPLLLCSGGVGGKYFLTRNTFSGIGLCSRR